MIPASLITDKSKISATKKVLTMYNQTTVTPMGQCTVTLCNPKNRKEYEIEFLVVNEAWCTPILGNSTIQVMELVQIQYHNILSVRQSRSRKKHYLRSIPMCSKEPESWKANTNSKSSKMPNR